MRPVHQKVRACHTFDREALLEYRRQIAAADPGGELVHSAVWCVSFDSFDPKVFRPITFESCLRYPDVSKLFNFCTLISKKAHTTDLLAHIDPT